MKPHLRFIALILCLTACLAGCAPQPPASSTPEPEASDAPPVSSGEPNLYDAATMQEIDASVATDLAALAKAMNAEPTLTVEGLYALIDAAGWAVRGTYNTQPRNEAVLLDFMAKFSTGEAGYAIAVAVNAYSDGGPMLSGDVLFFDGTGFYYSYMYIARPSASRDYDTYLDERRPLESLTLTDSGYLMMQEVIPEDSTGGTRGYRIIPLPEGCHDALITYVHPLGGGSDSGILHNWSRNSGYDGLLLCRLFEHLYMWEEQPEYGDADYIRRGDIPEDSHTDFPAATVEALMQRYLDIDTEALRSMEDYIWLDERAQNYNPNTGTYRFYGFRGGGGWPNVEVWDARTGPDGTLSLDIAFVAPDWGDPGYINSTLVVEPGADGGFTYVSNTFSNEKVRRLFEEALEHANRQGVPIVNGTWSFEGFEVVEKAPRTVAANMTLDTADGPIKRLLRLQYDVYYRRWQLDDSYAGNVEAA